MTRVPMGIVLGLAIGVVDVLLICHSVSPTNVLQRYSARFSRGSRSASLPRRSAFQSRQLPALSWVC